MPSPKANPKIVALSDRDNLYDESRSHHVSNGRWLGEPGKGLTIAEWESTRRALTAEAKGVPRRATFQVDAVDADRDMLVQEGTPYERAARPKVPRPIVPAGASDRARVGEEFDPDTYRGFAKRGQKAEGIPIDYPFPKITYGKVDYIHEGVRRYLDEHPEYDQGEFLESYDDVMSIEENQRVLSAAYIAAPDLDTSPEVEAAYKQFRVEVEEQYRFMTETLGIKHEIVDYDPYPNVEAMIYDVRVNNRIKSLATRVTGSHEDVTDEQNDHLRAVHDVFGHAASGRGFDRHGEESAYQAHAGMFGPQASRVAFTEFRAQVATMIVTGERHEQKHMLLPDILGDIHMDVRKDTTPIEVVASYVEAQARKNKKALGYGTHESGVWVPWSTLDEMELDLAAAVKAGGPDRNRGGAEKLRRYWTHGAGAAKIAWGTPGDFKRCVALLEEHMPGRAEGYCANRHKEATGGWPGRGHGGHKDDVYDENHPDVVACFDAEQAEYEAWAKTLDPSLIEETKALNIPGIFDLAGWVRALAKDARDLLTRVYVDAAAKELTRLRDQVAKIEDAGLPAPITPGDIDFDVNLPDVAAAITNQVNRIARVDEATFARIADTLSEGEAKGESMPKLADRVRSVFETSKMRAMRIARTEVTAGANSAQMLAAQRNGATTKTWLSIQDPRTREAHRLMDHRTVPIDGHFAVPLVEGGVPLGAVPMEYPGDPAAPPSLTVNCRCTMIYGYGIDYPGAPESAEFFGRTA